MGSIDNGTKRQETKRAHNNGTSSRQITYIYYSQTFTAIVLVLLVTGAEPTAGTGHKVIKCSPFLSFFQRYIVVT